MQAARLPYTRRNGLYATIFLLVTAGYLVQLHAFNIEAEAQNVRGYEGEASFLLVLPMLLLLFYSGAFALAAGSLALVRGSRPNVGLGLICRSAAYGAAAWGI